MSLEPKQIAAHSWVGIRALWPLWVGIIAFVAVYLILVAWGCRERDIRLVGMFLQLGGFLIVAKGLRDSGILFKRPTILARVGHYFKSFPRRHTTTHVLSAQGISVGISMPTPRLLDLPGPNTPLEKRVEMLEERTKILFDEVGDLGRQIEAQAHALTLKVIEEVTQIKAEQRALEEQLERAVIGGIHVEWWGVGFFIAGIVFASASPELAVLLGNAGNCGS